MSNPMGLTIPTASQTPGPDYANEVNDDLTLVAEHDHTTGKGVKVPAAGLDINADLPFGSNDATELRSARFTEQSAPLDAGTDVGCLSDVEGDLYWNNGDGVPVKITDGTGLNASAIGGFTGLSGTTGAATYASGPGSFEFTSSPGVPATVKIGPLVSENAAGRQITISPPAGTGNYGLTLPTALPASDKILQVSSTGVIKDSLDVDNSSLEISSSTMRVKAGGVTNAMLAALGQQISSSSSNSTSTTSNTPATLSPLTVTITGTGRPIFVGCISENGISPLNASGWQVQASGSGDANAAAEIAVTGSATTTIAPFNFRFRAPAAGFQSWPPSAIGTIYIPSGAGTYTFTVKGQISGSDAASQLYALYMQLIAYEL
jgi:hypothetical protein